MLNGRCICIANACAADADARNHSAAGMCNCCGIASTSTRDGYNWTCNVTRTSSSDSCPNHKPIEHLCSRKSLGWHRVQCEAIISAVNNSCDHLPIVGTAGCETESQIGPIPRSFILQLIRAADSDIGKRQE